MKPRSPCQLPSNVVFNINSTCEKIKEKETSNKTSWCVELIRELGKIAAGKAMVLLSSLKMASMNPACKRVWMCKIIGISMKPWQVPHLYFESDHWIIGVCKKLKYSARFNAIEEALIFTFPNSSKIWLCNSVLTSWLNILSVSFSETIEPHTLTPAANWLLGVSPPTRFSNASKKSWPRTSLLRI